MNADVIEQDTKIQTELASMRPYWKWLLGMGIATFLAGLLALSVPLVASLTVGLVIGSLLLIDGVLQGIHYYHLRNRKGYGWRGLGALFSVIAGLLLLLFPMEGVMSLTLIIGVYFIISGIVKMALALELRPVHAWGWLLFSSVLSLLLGVLVLSVWPAAAGWVIGILVGIDLMFAGWWMAIFAIALKKTGDTNP